MLDLLIIPSDIVDIHISYYHFRSTILVSHSNYVTIYIPQLRAIVLQLLAIHNGPRSDEAAACIKINYMIDFIILHIDLTNCVRTLWTFCYWD